MKQRKEKPLLLTSDKNVSDSVLTCATGENNGTMVKKCVAFVRIACLLATQETWFKSAPDAFSLFAKSNMDSFQAKDKTWLGVDALLRDFQHLIDDKDTADVLFLVGEGETAIYAHRLILVARCRHFQNRKKELWSSKSVHSQLTVRKPEFRPDVFREVLTFVYTGKVIAKR